MKLNSKGWDLFYKWEAVYRKELEKQRKLTGDPDWIDGWCIIDGSDHIHSIEDAVGVAVFGDDDDAIYRVLENYDPDEHYAFGYTAEQFVEMLKPYFDIDEGENIQFGGEV